MGMNILKKGVWVLLFFSLALNIGFVVLAAGPGFLTGFRLPPPPPPGPEPVLRILDTMDLDQEVKSKVVSVIKAMDEEHRNYFRQLLAQEEKLLALIGQPGELEMETLAPLIEKYSLIRQQSAVNKARHVVEIRRLLGREKSLYLISEIKKDFRKWMAREKKPD